MGLLIALSALAILSTVPAAGQSVLEDNGNIYLESTTGTRVQLTSSGKDYDPSLSADGKLVVFGRKTPDRMVNTGFGDTEATELWFVPADRSEPARRALAGRAGGFDPKETLVLAEMSEPMF